MNDDVILELLIGTEKFFLTVILLSLQGGDLPAKELDSLLQLLGEKKRKLEQEEADSNMEILLDFLHRVWQRKQDELHEVNFGSKTCSQMYIYEDTLRVILF